MNLMAWKQLMGTGVVPMKSGNAEPSAWDRVVLARMGGPA